ncbi:MAG TPA: rod-binding protein [Solirubrobacteraceae bacterium]|nr:rod-binding protein [Solirubrobacteraceae bacterium]
MITPILPPEVRNAAPEVQRKYRAALGFEHVLLTQLTTAMSATAGGEDEGASAATKTYRDMLPGTMADALVDAGGIGLASALVRTLKTGTP